MHKKFAVIGFLILTLLSVGIFVIASDEVKVSSVITGSTPVSLSEVYRGMKITYTFDFLLSGIDPTVEIPVEEQSELKLVVTNAQYITCANTSFSQKISTEYVAFAVDCTVKDDALWKASLASPQFLVTLDGNSISESLEHDGFVMVDDISKNASMAEEFAKEDENLNTTLAFSVLQHPNRLLNGTSDKNGNIQARKDKADVTYTEMSLSLASHNPSFSVYPEKNSNANNLYSSSVRINPCDGRSNCSGSSCSLIYYSDQPLTANEDGILVEETLVRYYNPSNTATTKLTHLTELSSNNVDVSLKVILPIIPTLVFSGNISEKIKNDVVKTSSGVSVIANDFIRLGGSFPFSKSDFSSRAIYNGKNGNIQASVSGKILKTEWKYKEDTTQNNQLSCPYTITHYYSCDCDEGGCSTCSYNTNHTTSKYYPVFAWERVGNPEELSFELMDSTSVDVFSSAAWIQTKGGHLGTNNSVSTAGTEVNNFKFSSGEILSDLVVNGGNSCGLSSCVRTIPLDYTPMNQTNADFMVYAGGDPEKNSFVSAPNWYKEIENTGSGSESQKKYGYGLRGDEYDRENSPRSYSEDVFDREMFGEVVDFSSLASFSAYGNIQKSGNTFTIVDNLKLEKGKIYVFPKNATLILGRLSEDLKLSGGSVRIFVDGTVKIEGNIVYGSHRSKNYLEIPNLRIEAKRIEINREVEYIESQLQADYFSTGASAKQLRILGDVIAKETHFQREPTSVSSPEEMENNPPSEMIIEDFRKYVLPVPGDTVLRDAYDVWQQVNPITGEMVDPY